MRAALAFALGLAAVAPWVATAAPLRVLAIGNSYTYSLDEDEGIFRRVAAAAGCELDFRLHARGGWTLEKHWKNRARTRLAAVLASKRWDAVVFQQLSHGSMREETFLPWIDNLVALVREKTPGAKLYVQETWSDTIDSARITSGIRTGSLGVTQREMYGLPPSQPCGPLSAGLRLDGETLRQGHRRSCVCPRLRSRAPEARFPPPGVRDEGRSRQKLSLNCKRIAARIPND